MDQAVLSLTEHFIQYRNRNNAAFNKLLQHPASTYAFQLVRISDQKHFGTRFEAHEELVSKPHIHHGRLIYNQKVGFQHGFFLPAAFLAMKVEDAVERLRTVDAGGLRHAAAGFSGWCSQHQSLFRIEHTEDVNDCFQNGTLARARTAGDD